MLKLLALHQVALLCGLCAAEYRESSYHQISNRTVLQNDSCVLQGVSTTEYSVSIIECAAVCQHTDQCVNYQYNSQESLCQLCVKPQAAGSLPLPPDVYVGGETYVKTISYPQDCADIFSDPEVLLPAESGVYDVYTGDNGDNKVHVFCDMETDNGGWTVFQRRKYGNVSFAKNWSEYKQGFGDLHGDFWLGNEIVSDITSKQGTSYQLRVDLESFGTQTAYALYDDFVISDEHEGYKLNIGSYSGTAGDGLAFHRGMKFTTLDVDNDKASRKNCATYSGNGGFWYEYCADATLTGVYVNFETTSKNDGIFWRKWLGLKTLKTVEMKFRPK